MINEKNKNDIKTEEIKDPNEKGRHPPDKSPEATWSEILQIESAREDDNWEKITEKYFGNIILKSHQNIRGPKESHVC